MARKVFLVTTVTRIVCDDDAETVNSTLEIFKDKVMVNRRIVSDCELLEVQEVDEVEQD